MRYREGAPQHTRRRTMVVEVAGAVCARGAARVVWRRSYAPSSRVVHPASFINQCAGVCAVGYARPFCGTTPVPRPGTVAGRHNSESALGNGAATAAEYVRAHRVCTEGGQNPGTMVGKGVVSRRVWKAGEGVAGKARRAAPVAVMRRMSARGCACGAVPRVTRRAATASRSQYW